MTRRVMLFVAVVGISSCKGRSGESTALATQKSQLNYFECNPIVTGSGRRYKYSINLASISGKDDLTLQFSDPENFKLLHEVQGVKRSSILEKEGVFILTQDRKGFDYIHLYYGGIGKTTSLIDIRLSGSRQQEFNTNGPIFSPDIDCGVIAIGTDFE